jgi:23S rRNA U2552 (ribose-2'-O)-methylase RlmE/FtsJ
MEHTIYKLDKKDNKPPPKIDIQFSLLDITDDIISDQYIDLISSKNEIETLENNNTWDKYKKYSNNFELIYLPNKKYKNDSISKYEPLSRSYFKLLEMIVDFDLLSIRKNMKIACLAEGPGGFVESIINYRKRVGEFEDKIHAITLKSDNNNIPGWKKTKNFIKKNPNIDINYGSDGTGNLYKLCNIIEFCKQFNNDADFITSDGGFDFSYNFNKQEQLSYRILFCEIVTALSIQKKGGSFVIKFFDIYTQVTYSLLYLLYSHYKYIYITKPNTSRPANSEKYIICKGFTGIDELYLKKLYIMVNNYEYISDNDMFVTKLFEINDEIFIGNLKKINNSFNKIQIDNIYKTLELIDSSYSVDIDKSQKCDSPIYDSDDSDTNENIKDFDILNQTIIAYKWCKLYKVSINYNSKYIKKYKSMLCY